MFQGKPPQAPILLELSQHIQKNRLSKAWFTRILDERVKQTETDKFRSLKDVEDAAENTVTCLNYLLLQTKGIADLNADHAASHLGRCQGLVTHLRGVRYHATRGKVYLPIELIIKHKVSQEQVLRQKDDASLRDLAYEVASQAHIHLEKARGFKNKVPRDAYPFFLNSVICEKYLKDLQLANFNIFHESLYLSPTKQRLAWRLLVQKYLKRTY
ncbi:hypothetical protein DPMN_089030 [Dreissena polymorpha]|uniref:NADH dehydrogenase (Ubiquinone) complex I, assembly factor 6 n=1 Tax=Dreissena polymorpha TaxID=45954 RepID=A0A9D4KV67_DREPO|nr:hypothetical protein DPMN_089030 [Dreissena polymorpha]